jgi:hypothetical protein
MRRRFLWLGVFWLVSLHSLVAQPLLDELVESKYRFALSNNTDKPNNTDILIREHAYRMGKEPSDVTIVMHYDLIVRVNEAGKNSAVASVFFQFKSFGGDAQYLQIPFPSTMIPKQFEATMVVKDVKNTQVKEYSLSNSKVEAQCFLSETRLVGPFFPDIHEITIKQIRFEMPSDVLDTYFKFLERVGEYSSMSEDIERSDELLKGMETENRLSLSQLKADVDRMGEFLEEVLSNSLIGALNLRAYDPLFLIKRATDLKARQLQKKRYLEQRLKGLEIELYNSGVTQALAGNVDSADFFFRQSLEVNPLFTPARAEVAMGHFLRSEYAKAEGLLFDILMNGNPDPGTRVRVIEISLLLYNHNLANAKSALKDSLFDLAWEYFGRALEICGKFPSIPCNPSIREDQSKALLLGFEYKQVKLQQSVSEGNYELAKSLLLSQIKDYYRHQGFWKQVPLYPDVKPIKSQIAKGFSVLSESSFREGAYFLSAGYLQQALAWGATPLQYKEMIQKVVDLVVERTPANSLFAAIEPYMHLAVQSTIWDAQRDSFSIATFDAYPNYIPLISDAFKSVHENDYLNAKDLFKKASNYATKSGGMVLSVASDQLKMIEYALAYDTLLKQAELARQRNDYPAFFSLYSDAENKYWSYNLYHGLISHKPLWVLVMEMNADEKYEALLFYTSQDQAQKAIYLIRAFKGYKTKRKELLQMQSILGEQIAFLEFQKYPNDQPEIIIDFYTSNSPELRTMIRAIHRKWSALRF